MPMYTTLITADRLDGELGTSDYLIIDCRFDRMVTESGRSADIDALRAEFGRSLGTLPERRTVHYCGSGVSACHNVPAQVHALLWFMERVVPRSESLDGDR